ncbi:hypothetical protein GCM10008905_02410 [Clostridium malenominatum]|uniref:Uncharacterized protein n=1 Tax=Clostridium malenominatum TaxID=1539 RepID=A0ABN1IMS5_9CLOT
MKHMYKKVMTVFVTILLFATFMHTKKVQAYDNNSSLSFKINAIGDAKRRYDYNGEILTYYVNNIQVAEFSGRTYDMNTKEIVIQTKHTNYYDNTTVHVDGKFIGESTDVLLEFQEKEQSRYTTFAIKYLTPGKHLIEVRSAPYNLGGQILNDYCYVNIPVFEDEKIQQSIENINAGNATMNDYEIVGVNPLTISDLQSVNNKVKGKTVTAANVQETINQIVDEIKIEIKEKEALIKINTGTASINDYKAIGIENVQSNNLKQLNIAIIITRNSKECDLTKDEIKVVLDELPQKIEGSFASVNAGTATLDDYKLIGVTGVTDINLVDVNEALKDKEHTILSKLQTDANTIINSLITINSGTTTLSYYTKLGISTVQADNAKAVKEAIMIAKDAKGANLTKAEINQVINDVLNKIAISLDAVNAGIATLDDYKLIGVTGVTDVNLVDVNEALKGKEHSTLSKVQTDANTIINSLITINSGTTTLSYYTKLGINTVQSDNAKAVRDAIIIAKDTKGANLTKAEINQVINDVLNKIQISFGSVNAGTATLDDYKLIGVTGVTDINLVDVNEALKGKKHSTLRKVQADANTIITSLSMINSGTTTLSYYTKLGINTVQTSNVKAVRDAIIIARNAKGANLTKAEINQVIDNLLNNN